MNKCKWLPNITACTNFNKWNDYLVRIHKIFKKDFCDSKPIFEGKHVNFRKAPMDGKFEK